MKSRRGGARPGAGQPKGTKSKKVQAREAAQAAELHALGLTARKVLNEIALAGFSNVQDLFDATGNLRPIHTLTREQAACIASLEITQKQTDGGHGTEMLHKLKVWDKIKSLELLAKHFCLLTEKIEHSGQIAMPAQVIFELHRV